MSMLEVHNAINDQLAYGAMQTEDPLTQAIGYECAQPILPSPPALPRPDYEPDHDLERFITRCVAAFLCVCALVWAGGQLGDVAMFRLIGK